jgi:hypothetical protein
MRTLRFAAIGLLVVGASVFGWRTIGTGLHRRIAPPSAQPSDAQPASPPLRNLVSQVPSAAAPASESANHLGPFAIAGRNYTVELQTRKVQPGSTDEQGDTVVAMEIRDAAGAVQYRRTFPYQEKNEEFSDSWLVDARLLKGTNGTGLLVSYGAYSEPSAPEEEPTGLFQVFGVVNGKFLPFGPPVEVEGGLLDQYSEGHTYKASRPLGAQADVVEFKVWAGHCRLVYPVRVEWTQGKLSPMQECTSTAGGLPNGCEYEVVPEVKLYTQGLTFVRLWPGPDEKSGQPMKIVVKKDSKVDLLKARVATQWVEGNATPLSANSKGLLDGAGGFGLTVDAALWLKVRIDGKEGWMHTEEDFRALGLPEDE